MQSNIFSSSDVRQIEHHGLTVPEALRQIELFKKPPAYLKLHRPCVPGDGIRVLSGEEIRSFARLFDEKRDTYEVLKFVPASGAATRMFKILLKFFNPERPRFPASAAQDARMSDPEARALEDFFTGLPRFAFISDLEAAINVAGTSMEDLPDRASRHEILAFLLTDKGLGYASLPKGLTKFHQYNGETRTAFEEHLVEAASYAANSDGVCRLHFTVSQEHLQGFRSLLEKIRPLYEQRYEVSFKVDFSLQKKKTDTIAVDLDNRPFRLEDGGLLFRPGGHGALIENLGDLEADLVFIKNIDNVVPDRLKEATFQWKKILGGLFIRLQAGTFNYLKRLSEEPQSPGLLDDAMKFASTELHLEIDDDLRKESPEKLRRSLLEKLDRPLRVCGMVRNTGEPGGGPFWVEGKNGNRTCQIVETAQIDMQSEGQKEIVAASTHFNPVDLVCGMKDWKGRPFDLSRFVDHEAVFISRKSRAGRELKALELPGLWNGAMAYWNTVFVDVPSVTFNPVKTINDLLREEHQPA